MATPYPAHVNALQVGSYFVQQYYQVLQQRPDYLHQFYSDASTMVRVDGDASETASAMLQIHAVVTSLNFTAIEIKTINSLESWSGGVVVMVSGSVKSKDFNGGRKFVQTFFLAPQEKGYFVLNDIFHFVNEEVIHQNSAHIASENKHDSHLATNPGLEVPVSDYTAEVETREFISSVCMDGDDQVDEYSLQEHQQNEYGLQEPYQQHEYGLQEPYQQHEYGLQEPYQQHGYGLQKPYQQHEFGLQKQYQQHEYDIQEHYQQHEYGLQEQHQQHEPDAEIVQEEVPVDEQSDLLPNVEPVQEPLPPVEEPIGDLPKLSYASILRTSKGKSATLVTTKPSSAKIIQPSSERNHIPAPPVQQSNPELSSVQDHNADVADEGFLQEEEEGESKSVYVRNLPPTITTVDLLHEFKNIGRVRSDGVFIKNRKEVGVCYAFVEFEDFQGVQNAIKASPIQLAGRQVHIEGRRANSSSSAPRGGRGRGRGRGSYQNEGHRGRLGTHPSGRGSNQDAGDYKMKANGFRGSQ